MSISIPLNNYHFLNSYCVSCTSCACGGGLVPKSCPTLAIPWAIAHQAPLSMGFPKQEYWSGLPFSSPGDLPDSGTEPASHVLQVDSYH